MIEKIFDDYMEREFVKEKDMAAKVVEAVTKYPQLKGLTARKVGRNEICPCGSGLKFKKCCIRKVNQGVETFALD
jgi:uncharacterized protein YecA (UPF0149 family)